MPKMDYGKKTQGKKLSWVYRNKKRTLKNKKAEETPEDSTNVQIQNRKARIVIRNLSFKVTEDDIGKFYEPYGEIEEINLLRHPDGKLVGCGFVQFKRVEQASKAIFNTNKKQFLGRVITSDWAIPKYKFTEELEQDAEASKNVDEEENAEDSTSALSTTLESSETAESQAKSVSKKNDRKKHKADKLRKRARIIIRNLSFKITDDALREHFSKFGNIEEIKILTKPDGKLIGCAFIQFSRVQSAAKAIHHSNLQPLIGRPIVVDWAVPKKMFGSATEQEQTNEAKTEGVEVKVEQIDEDEDEHKISADVNDTVKEELKEVIEKESDDSDDEITEMKQEESESEDDIDEGSIKGDNGSIKEEESNLRRVSNDIGEGKTVFLKNVPFSAKNEDLRQCMEQFGPVYYALICMDHLTEHSKGTAFVKFVNVEDAEKCLSAGTELRLHEQVLDPHRALNRNDVQDKKTLKSQIVKDSRNLYLVKEGVILAGSSAAAGLSAGDMARRLQLEQWKSQMLRNLNMFVSRVRLVVHNLPVSVDDKKLRELFKNHSGPKAMIKEARVMRDLRNVDANGIGISKEYGFVTFSTHEDALQALRSINNNPNIFSKNKRPIVAFSIENRIMVNAKRKRVEKSRENNPLWPGGKTKSNNEPPLKRAKADRTNDDDNAKPYSGVASKPGESKMRSKFNLKTQAVMHNQVLKNEKKKMKSNRKQQTKRRQETSAKRENKPKQGTKKMSKDDVNFNKLVNSYKTKLMAVPQTKSKWYEA